MRKKKSQVQTLTEFAMACQAGELRQIIEVFEGIEQARFGAVAKPVSRRTIKSKVLEMQAQAAVTA